MRADWIFLKPAADRHLAAAERTEQRGDRETAGQHRALAAAYELYSEESDYRPERGMYLRPMAEFGSLTIPDMATVRDPKSLAVYRARMPRTHDLARKARLADVLWEFGADASAAREAADVYSTIASAIIDRGGEFDALFGAAALVRAYALSRSLRDATNSARLLDRVLGAIESLSSTSESAGLFMLVELLLAQRETDPAVLERIDVALANYLEGTRRARPADFNGEQRAVELQERVARARGDSSGATRYLRARGDAIVREAEAKLTGVPNGGLVAGYFFERAARVFEVLGDRTRADEIRARERSALRGAEFKTVEGEVEVDLKPYQRVIQKIIDAWGPEGFWLWWLAAVSLPSDEEIQKFERESNTPLLDSATNVIVDQDLIVEMPDSAGAKRRRARSQLYFGIRAHIYTLFGVGRDKFKVTAQAARDPLVASNRFDATSVGLLGRMLNAVDAQDWMAAIYLSGPLFERLLRAIAIEQRMQVQRKDRSSQNLIRVSMEDVLRAIAIPEPLRAFGQYVLARPGLNVRNEVGHGLLSVERCTSDLTAVLLFLICALAHAGPTTDPSSEV